MNGSRNALGRGIADARGLELRDDPPIHTERADAFDVTWTRTESESIQHVPHLLIGSLLTWFGDRHGLRSPRDTPRGAGGARDSSERDDNDAQAPRSHSHQTPLCTLTSLTTVSTLRE